MRDVYFRCSQCGGRILEPNTRNYIFRETDIPLRCILEKTGKLYGEILCRKCQGGNEMDNGKNFDGYLAAMAQASNREREKLLDKARNDKGITVAGYLKLENYVISMAGKEDTK